MNLDRNKYKALVHYICCSSDPSKLGTVKLHKILWLSDFLAFLNYDSPITGELYIKKQYGPFSTHLMNVLDELKSEGRLSITESEWAPGKTKRKFIANGEPDKTPFNREELRLIEDIRDYIVNDHTADSISKLSHDAIWEMALMNEPIPYETILVSDLDVVTKEDIEWAQKEINQAH